MPPPRFRPVTAPELAPGVVLQHETGHEVLVVVVADESAVGRRRERPDDPWSPEFFLALGRWRVVTGGA